MSHLSFPKIFVYIPQAVFNMKKDLQLSVPPQVFVKSAFVSLTGQQCSKT